MHREIVVLYRRAYGIIISLDVFISYYRSLLAKKGVRFGSRLKFNAQSILLSISLLSFFHTSLTLFFILYFISFFLSLDVVFSRCRQIRHFIS